MEDTGLQALLSRVRGDTHTEGEEGEESQGNGDDGLSDDVSLVLVLALVLVRVVGRNPI